MKKTCFVIQRFDNSTYDRRYRETFAPAIEAGGAQAVRADEILGTVPIISKIEFGIRDATIAFCDASEDNPNIFLELGFALAMNVPTVVVCDRSKRNSLPFDIAHRPVVFYRTDAQSDFDNLGREISENIRAALSEVVPTAKNNKSEIGEGDFDALPAQDLRNACLIELMDQDLRDPDGTSIWAIQKKLVGPGINERMVALAVAKLIDDGLVEKFSSFDRNIDEQFIALRLTDDGQRFLLRNYSDLMKRERDIHLPDDLDEIPF